MIQNYSPRSLLLSPFFLSLHSPSFPPSSRPLFSHPAITLLPSLPPSSFRLSLFLSFRLHPSFSPFSLSFLPFLSFASLSRSFISSLHHYPHILCPSQVFHFLPSPFSLLQFRMPQSVLLLFFLFIVSSLFSFLFLCLSFLLLSCPPSLVSPLFPPFSPHLLPLLLFPILLSSSTYSPLLSLLPSSPFSSSLSFLSPSLSSTIPLSLPLFQ